MPGSVKTLSHFRVSRNQHSLVPASGCFLSMSSMDQRAAGAHLEYCSTTKASPAAIKVSAFKRGAVEVSRRIHNQAGLWITAVGVTRKFMKDGRHSCVA